MTGAPPQAHALMSVLAIAGQVIARKQGLAHEQSLASLRNSALAHVVDALVSRRVDIVVQGFRDVLAQYGEQARHFMAQQQSYADKELDTGDPLRRIELRSRIHSIDVELASLRNDARMLYDSMNEVLLALGTPPSGWEGGLSDTLLLPSAGR